MKQPILIALIVGFCVGNISGYAIRVFTGPSSAQEKLAKIQLQSLKDDEKELNDTQNSVQKMLGK